MHRDYVSVIIPTWNRADKLARSVKSVLDQTHGALELIVVDDASTDDTERVVSGFNDNRIIYHRLEENGGAGRARNEGVMLAQYDLIAFQDSDDEWIPEKLEKQVSYMQAHPAFSMVYCKFRNIVNGSDSFDVFSRFSGGNMEGDIFSDLLSRNTIGTPTVLVKREAFISCGGFDITYRCLEDWECFLRFSRDHSIGFIDEYLVNAYREIGTGVSSDVVEHFRSRLRMLKEHQAYLEQNRMLAQELAGVFAEAKMEKMEEEVKRMFIEIFYPFAVKGEKTDDD